MPAARLTYRARVLAVLNASPHWLTARTIAQDSGLSYDQTIFALNALLNCEAIARQGKKSTARWGSLVLIEHAPDQSALHILERLLYGLHR